MKSTKRAWFPWLVTGLLVAHVAGMAIAVVVATGDHTFVALPDYYGKAIRWDQSQEAARRSQALGWDRTITLSTPGADGKRTIGILITDSSGKPLNGLKVAANVYPELSPRQTMQITFTETDGNYAATLAPTHRGPIVVELQAQRGTETYLTKANLFVGGAR